jgi:ArsR family transcriptional regulator
MVSKLERQKAQQVSRIFKLAASPTRVLILTMIAKGKSVPVGEIAEGVGMTHSAVSHQLGLLSRSKVVDFKKEGRSVRYALAKSPEAKALARFLSAVR